VCPPACPLPSAQLGGRGWRGKLPRGVDVQQGGDAFVAEAGSGAGQKEPRDVPSPVSRIHAGHGGAPASPGTETAEAFRQFSRQVFADGALPEKTKQLIAVAVAHTTQCPYCIRAHTRAALR